MEYAAHYQATQRPPFVFDAGCIMNSNRVYGFSSGGPIDTSRAGRSYSVIIVDSKAKIGKPGFTGQHTGDCSESLERSAILISLLAKCAPAVLNCTSSTW